MSLMTRRSSKSTSPPDEMLLETLCHNEIFDVLGNRRRRYILCYLVNRDGPAECRELAEQIAAWETDSDRDEVRTSKYQSVYNSLYQTHLPELESEDLIEYDRSENLVVPTNRMTEIESFVDSAVPRFNNRLTSRLLELVSGVLLVGVVVGALVVAFSGTAYLYVSVVMLVSFALILGGSAA